MIKKKLYLHIGMPKTGSTSLQSYLFDNKNWLCERGFLVPESTRKDHHPLVQSILLEFTDYYRPGSKFSFQGNHETLWSKLRDEINHSSCRNILLSSEMFPQLAFNIDHSQSGLMLKWLSSQLQDFDVYVICYLRSLDKFAKSHYKTHVKDRRISSTLEEWMRLQNTPQSNYLKPSIFLNAFATQFGLDKLLLRQYDRSKLINKNIVDDFLDLIGLPCQVLARVDKQRNRSLPDELVDIKRTFNAIASPSPNLSKRVGCAMTQFATGHFDTPPANGSKFICEAMEQEHRTILDRYGLDLGEIDNPFSDINEYSAESRGQTVLLSALYAQIQQLQNQVPKLQNEILKLRNEVQRLRSADSNKALHDQIQQSHTRLEKLIRDRTSLQKRIKSLFSRLLQKFSKR